MAVQTITKPQGQSVNIAVEPGQTIAFDFDIGTSSFERMGNDLAVSLDSGEQLVLSNFFVGDAGGSLPPLQLADGTEISSGDFLVAMAPDMDLTPAADAATAGSGINAYTDGAGSLVNGLDLSDDLGSFYWGPENNAGTEEYSGISAAGGGALPPPPPSNPAYNARAVLYSSGDVADFHIRTDSTKAVDTISSVNGLVKLNNGDITDLTAPPESDGSYMMGFKGADLSTFPGGKAYDYITITYTDGSTEVIQLVVTDSKASYSSADENAANPPGTPGNTIVGEWHTQVGGVVGTGGGDRTMSNGTSNTYDGSNSTNDEVWMKGMRAHHDSSIANEKNIIKGGTGNDKVYITGGVSAYGDPDKNDNVSNTISLSLDKDDDSSITAGGTVYAEAGGANTMTAGTIGVRVTTGSFAVKGVGGENDLNAGTGGIQIEAIGSNLMVGLEAFNQTKTTPMGEEIYVGSNKLTSEGNIKVEVTGGKEAIGLHAVKGTASNELGAARDIELIVKGSESSTGLSAYGGEASNTLTADGKVTIDVTGRQGDQRSSHGMKAGDDEPSSEAGGKNIINAADVEITVKSTSPEAGVSQQTQHNSGMFAWSKESGITAVNEISASNSVVIDVSNDGYGAIGMKAGGTIGPAGDPTGSSYQVQHALNSIEVKDGSGNITGSVEINLSGNTSMGMSANSTDRTDTDIDYDKRDGNSITASTVTIDTSGTQNFAYGMHADNNATNTITANVVNITAATDNYNAYSKGLNSFGMYAGNSQNTGSYADKPGATNLIQAASDAITVTITAKNGPTADGFAMYAAQNGINVIRGGNGADNITLNGGIHAAGDGQNIISTGVGDGTADTGNDIIVINGNISAAGDGQNVINTYGGSDTITLNGKVGAEALIIDMGDGTDKLILKADSFAEFKDYYDDWLTNLDSDTFKGIEMVTPDVTDPNEYQDVYDYLTDIFASYPNIDIDVVYALDVFMSSSGIDSITGSYAGSGGISTLGVDGLLDTDTASELSLSNLVGIVEGFEHIDLSGDSADILSIDSLLTDLEMDTSINGNTLPSDITGLDVENGMSLRVTGDAGDEVHINHTVWQNSGTTYDVGGQTYSVYTSNLSDADGQYLLLQTGLTIM